MAMRIELEKRSEGGAVLRCIRGDGTTTWQRHDGHQAAFFPFHDLTHYAVEQTLGLRDGFFGLVAAGWPIEATTGKGSRGPLPPGAVFVEQLVGLLDRERASASHWPADDFNQALAESSAPAHVPPFRLSERDLARVRAQVLELHARWRALPARGVLELTFDDLTPS